MAVREPLTTVREQLTEDEFKELEDLVQSMNPHYQKIKPMYLTNPLNEHRIITLITLNENNIEEYLTSNAAFYPYVVHISMEIPFNTIPLYINRASTCALSILKFRLRINK